MGLDNQWLTTEDGDPMKSLSAILGVILIGLAIFGCGEVRGADWRFYSSSDYRDNYYDAESITHPSKNIVGVSVKDLLTEKGTNYLVIKLGEKFRAASFGILFYEVHCTEKKLRFLSATIYSKDGNVLSMDNNPGASWTLIIPESNDELLYKAVCKDSWNEVYYWKR
jgi:hypothetical protein